MSANRRPTKGQYPFTDDQIGKLTKQIKHNLSIINILGWELKALIDRLDAAERCAELLDSAPSAYTERERDNAVIEWYWRAGQ